LAIGLVPSLFLSKTQDNDDDQSDGNDDYRQCDRSSSETNQNPGLARSRVTAHQRFFSAFVGLAMPRRRSTISLCVSGGVFIILLSALFMRSMMASSFSAGSCFVGFVGVRGMPERLSVLRPDADVRLWPGPLHNAAVALRVSNIICLSAQVDHELSLLLVRILGANARVAHAMFDAIRSPI
jgi:hypothetical protein